MEIIKLPSVIEKDRKRKRSNSLKKNNNAYRHLKEMMVPNELKLWQFRKYYHPVLSIKEKKKKRLFSIWVLIHGLLRG